jgi:NAD+ kinase
MSGQRVGIVGGERVAEAIEAAGGEPVDDDTAFDTVAFVVAETESAITDLARDGLDAPILAVDVEGVPSTPIDRLEASIECVRHGAVPTMRHPVVAAAGSFDPIRAVFDVALMAAEPARISEFSVHCAGEEISRFRADGVVASTPAGSVGYNRNAGGPIVAPETGVASIVPIAPFATAAGDWILSIDDVELRVERDETPVELLADGRRELPVAADDAIALSTAGTIETYVPPGATGAFGDWTGEDAD